MPAVVVYYCDILCKQYPKVDSAFTELLGDDLKSDSMSDPSFSGGSVASSGSSKASSKASLISSFRDCLVDAHNNAASNTAHRKALLDLKKRKVDAEIESKNWTEHSEACERFERLHQSGTCKTL